MPGTKQTEIAEHILAMPFLLILPEGWIFGRQSLKNNGYNSRFVVSFYPHMRISLKKTQKRRASRSFENLLKFLEY